jgi:hypothetical protein
MQRSLLSLAVAVLVACGGSSSKNPDASTHDSKVFQDSPASTGLMGLGQKCGTGLPACPTNAPSCVGIALPGGGASTQYCTPHCDDNATAKTDATGNFPNSASGFTPAPDPSKCGAAFTGTAGTPACGLFLTYTPMDNPPKPNKTYTGISLGCLVVCGTGNACPTGTTCNTTLMFCFPN